MDRTRRVGVGVAVDGRNGTEALTGPGVGAVVRASTIGFFRRAQFPSAQESILRPTAISTTRGLVHLIVLASESTAEVASASKV